MARVTTLGAEARFVDRLAIHETSAFAVSSAFDLERGLAVTLVEARQRDAASEAALDALHRAHQTPPHEAIAPSLERWSEATFSAVVLGVPAVIDLDGAVRLGSERGVRIAHAEADGLVTTLRDALRASARAAERPSSDRHLGTLSLSNVLLSATGRFWLVGLGHNVIVQDAHGRLAPRGRFFQAPEIALGAPPTEQSDFVSLLVLLRGMAGFVDVHRAIVEIAAGSSLRQDLELLERVLWIERRVIHAPPSARASIDEAIAVGDRIRALIGVQPDVQAFVRRMGDLLGGTVALEAPRERAVLRVDTQGRWLERGRGPRVDLSRRTVLGRMAVVLARARLERPGRGLELADLAAACWPGERIVRSAAANRVYVAISGLRRAGLAADLEKCADGYRISPELPCELVDE